MQTETYESPLRQLNPAVLPERRFACFGLHEFPKCSSEIKGNQLIRRLASAVMIYFIRFYQIGISPLIGPNCRFTPTCSQYTIEAIQKYGPIRGSWRAVKRILRCHPWNPGGHDPP